MKLIIRSIKPVVILSSLLLTMPMAAVADKPDAGVKGGKPNKNSVAETAACIKEDNTARVCSCKGLSNVVLWCGTTWVKHEDFGSGADSDEVYDATVGCVDSEGNLVPGDITMVAIKSGSQKNAKHNPEVYVSDETAPPGSGLVTSPEACSTDFACPAAGDCSGITEPPGDEPPGDEEPPVMG
jgi:hypothetical protein